MDKTSAQRIVRDTFKASFDRKRFRDFVSELCNGFDEAKAISSMGVPDAFSDHIKSCQRLGTFESADGELADVLIVHLTESFKLERTRTALRDFVAHKLKRDESYKEAGLVAFVAPDSRSPDEIRALQLSKAEIKYIRPWFKNSDINRYVCAAENSFNLIYRSSKHLEDNLPNIKAHLARFKEILVNRNVRAGEVTLSQYDNFVRGKGHIDYVMIASAMKAGNYYCLSYARDEDLFDGPKIVSPQRSFQNTFCYNDVPWYASADVYYITQIDLSIELKYVLALLNSKLYFVWLYCKGKRKGEMLELYQKPLSEIPIRVISPKEQKPFIALVDKILAAKQLDAKADTSAPAHLCVNSSKARLSTNME